MTDQSTPRLTLSFFSKSGNYLLFFILLIAFLAVPATYFIRRSFSPWWLFVLVFLGSIAVQSILFWILIDYESNHSTVNDVVSLIVSAWLFQIIAIFSSIFVLLFLFRFIPKATSQITEVNTMTNIESKKYWSWIGSVTLSILMTALGWFSNYLSMKFVVWMKNFSS